MTLYVLQLYSDILHVNIVALLIRNERIETARTKSICKHDLLRYNPLTLLSNTGVPVIAPSMWTTPQVNEFKEKTQQDSESVITVGRGEVLTVHIPTHDDGSTFCWEFATDGYDIAFGLYFEWPEEINGERTETVKELAFQLFSSCFLIVPK